MRIRYSAAGILFVLVLALGLVASAQTPENSSPPPTSPQTTTPNPNAAPDQPQAPPQSAQPAQPGSQSQGTPQAGSAAPSGQQAAQPRTPGDELNLTEAQKQQLRPIIDKEVKEIEAVRDDPSMSTDQKRTKVEQIRQNYFPQIQAILTPEQRQKLEEMRKEKQQQQQASPQGTNPQGTNPQGSNPPSPPPR